jgi:isopentenyldiphosphate isomerase
MADDMVHASADDPNEIFDLVDEQDHVIGTVRRGEVHGNPRLIHRSVQVLVFDSWGRLFLQRRSLHKDLFPGYLCASASGHVDAGESYAATAQREVREELGIAMPLRELGKITIRSEMETEITVVFMGYSDGPFVLHPTETNGGLFVTPDALVAGIEHGSLPLTPAAVAAIAVATETGSWSVPKSIGEHLVRLLTK